jgi:hypothetical protein
VRTSFDILELKGSPTIRRIHLYRLSLRYRLDSTPNYVLPDAMCAPPAIDFAGGDDILDMERVVGPTFLTQALKAAPVGAMRPNS